MQKSQLKEFGGDSNIENGLVDTVKGPHRPAGAYHGDGAERRRETAESAPLHSRTLRGSVQSTVAGRCPPNWPPDFFAPLGRGVEGRGRGITTTAHDWPSRNRPHPIPAPSVSTEVPSYSAKIPGEKKKFLAPNLHEGTGKTNQECKHPLLYSLW